MISVLAVHQQRKHIFHVMPALHLVLTLCDIARYVRLWNALYCEWQLACLQRF